MIVNQVGFEVNVLVSVVVLPSTLACSVPSASTKNPLPLNGSPSRVKVPSLSKANTCSPLTNSLSPLPGAVNNVPIKKSPTSVSRVTESGLIADTLSESVRPALTTVMSLAELLSVPLRFEALKSQLPTVNTLPVVGTCTTVA